MYGLKIRSPGPQEGSLRRPKAVYLMGSELHGKVAELHGAQVVIQETLLTLLDQHIAEVQKLQDAQQKKDDEKAELHRHIVSLQLKLEAQERLCQSQKAEIAALRAEVEELEDREALYIRQSYPECQTVLYADRGHGIIDSAEKGTSADEASMQGYCMCQLPVLSENRGHQMVELTESSIEHDVRQPCYVCQGRATQGTEGHEMGTPSEAGSSVEQTITQSDAVSSAVVDPETGGSEMAHTLEKRGIRLGSGSTSPESPLDRLEESTSLTASIDSLVEGTSIIPSNGQTGRQVVTTAEIGRPSAERMLLLRAKLHRRCSSACCFDAQEVKVASTELISHQHYPLRPASREKDDEITVLKEEICELRRQLSTCQCKLGEFAVTKQRMERLRAIVRELLQSRITKGVDSAQALKCLSVIRGHSGAVSSVATVPHTTHVLSASSDTTLRVWDAASGQCRAQLEGHGAAATCVQVSADGSTAASSSTDKTIRVWNLSSSRSMATLTGHTGSVLSLAYSRYGSQLASGSTDSTARIWDLRRNICVQVLCGHQGPVHCVAYSPNGQHLATASADMTIRIWDAATLNCTQVLKSHSAPVRTLAFSPCGSYLATGGEDCSIHLWNSSTWQLLSNLPAHRSAVLALAFSPDGLHLASGGYDGSVLLWMLSGATDDVDFDPLHCIATLSKYRAPVTCVAFSSDGLRLISGSQDASLCVWGT